MNGLWKQPIYYLNFLKFRILPWTPPTIRQKLSPIPLSLRNLSPRLNLSNLKPMTICSPHCQQRPQVLKLFLSRFLIASLFQRSYKTVVVKHRFLPMIFSFLPLNLIHIGQSFLKSKHFQVCITDLTRKVKKHCFLEWFYDMSNQQDNQI